MSYKNVFKNFCAVSVFLVAAHVMADERPEVGRYVQGYSGEEGVKVYIVRLGAADKSEALVQITGIDHKTDGVIHKATLVNNGDNRRSYNIKLEGNKEETEVLRMERNGSRLLMRVYPHGWNDYAISYNEELSQSINAEHFLTKFLEQE